MQDQVPPFPSATALSIVEEELGGSVEDIFDRFDYEPIAAASLGKRLCDNLLINLQEMIIKLMVFVFNSYRASSPCKT